MSGRKAAAPAGIAMHARMAQIGSSEVMRRENPKQSCRSLMAGCAGLWLSGVVVVVSDMVVSGMVVSGMVVSGVVSDPHKERLPTLKIIDLATHG